MLEPGMKVPDFTLYDANGNAVSLHDRASKTVVYRSIPRTTPPAAHGRSEPLP